MGGITNPLIQTFDPNFVGHPSGGLYIFLFSYLNEWVCDFYKANFGVSEYNPKAGNLEGPPPEVSIISHILV